MYDLVVYGKGFGFESEWDAKVLESFEQRSDAIWCTFLKDHWLLCWEIDSMGARQKQGLVVVIIQGEMVVVWTRMSRTGNAEKWKDLEYNHNLEIWVTLIYHPLTLESWVKKYGKAPL